MITVLAHRSALVGLSWRKKTRECAVRFGTYCGLVIGRESWIEPFEWLHVPSMKIAREIIDGCPVDATMYGAAKAKAVLGEAWPLVAMDEEGKVKVTRGIPRIAGGTVPDVLEESDGKKVDGWEVKSGKVSPVAISTAAELEEVIR